jgi:hypothetical protein
MYRGCTLFLTAFWTGTLQGFQLWCGARCIQQAAQAEDEAAAEAAVLEEWEAQGGDSDEPDPDKFTDPWDESYNAMDDYWYY